MDTNTVLSNILQEELQYFYNHIRDYDEKRKIDIAMVDDVYAKVLEYDMGDVQKDAVMNTVAGADKSVVLSEGTVAEQGNSDTLLKKNGIYAHMVKLQTQSQHWAME